MKSLQFDVWDSNNLQRKDTYILISNFISGLYSNLTIKEKQATYKLSHDTSAKYNIDAIPAKKVWRIENSVLMADQTYVAK